MDRDALDIGALGRAIVQRRQRLGWPSFRLAARAGVSDPYLAQLERGEGKRVGIDVVARIASALGTTIDDLLHEAGLPTAQSERTELSDLYTDLNQPERRALLRMGEALRDLQGEYEDIQRIAEEPAAYGDPLPDPPHPDDEPEPDDEE